LLSFIASQRKAKTFIVCLMATFVLGELFKIAESVTPGHNDIDVGLTWHDTFIVLGTLLGSLLIYKAITYFLK
jgi:hypothetical protein